MPDHHVFEDPILGKITVAGETLDNMKAEAERKGLTLDQLWGELIAEESERIQRHLEKN